MTRALRRLASRKRNEDALEAIITEWTSKRRVVDVVDVLQAAGVAAGACADNKYLARIRISQRASTGLSSSIPKSV